MCDEAGPGMCFAGQVGAGSLFGLMFGGVTKGFFGSDKVWWSVVPGVAAGVCMGTMAAQQPDGPPSAAHFWVVTNTAVASTMASAWLLNLVMGETPLVFTVVMATGITALVQVLYNIHGSWRRMQAAVIAQLREEDSKSLETLFNSSGPEQQWNRGAPVGSGGVGSGGPEWGGGVEAGGADHGPAPSVV